MAKDNFNICLALADIPPVFIENIETNALCILLNGRSYEDMTEDQVRAIVREELAGYATTASVDSKITAATSDFVTNEDVDAKIALATGDFVSNATFQSAIAQLRSEYYTKEEIDEKLAEISTFMDGARRNFGFIFEDIANFDTRIKALENAGSAE